MPERRPRLEGKVAIVTGAGSSGPGIGNGKATAILFAREGAKVLLVDALPDRAQETLAAILQEGGDASVFQADVTSDDDCRSLVEAAIQRYERLDILMNNVGISKRGSVLDVTEEEWDRVMAVNVKSMLLTSRHAIPRMMETGGGSIINISSTAGLRAHHSTPYTASKAAVIGLTFSMAADHGRDNVRVNASPPALSTRLWWPRAWMAPSATGAATLLPSAPRGPDGISATLPSTSPARKPAGLQGSSFRWTPGSPSPRPSPTSLPDSRSGTRAES